MSEQDDYREAQRYQEWCAERDAHEEQQYHIYLEGRIKELNEALCECNHARITQVADAKAKAHEFLNHWESQMRELSEWWAGNSEPQSEAWDLSRAIIATLNRMKQ